MKKKGTKTVVYNTKRDGEKKGGETERKREQKVEEIQQ